MILGQTVFEIFEELISCRTNKRLKRTNIEEAYSNSAFRQNIQQIENRTADRGYDTTITEPVLFQDTPVTGS